ncbi:hypothetical protein GGI11_004528 [Coemansia sp. RSA 2049]|nr:hypothetical protein H4217_008213 [Coemansia sp. RSA 1939]KAJ2513083.1 hypothetical protein GGI11_004528 [Coemansia sp. RSA 2049]KAJ2594378.1 hypothetical protein EV177_008383 [Coemansia sp. RSA 1804]
MNPIPDKAPALGGLSVLLPLVAQSPRPPPSFLSYNPTVDDDLKLLDLGAAKALDILNDKLKNELEDYVLEMLSKAETEPAESPAETPYPVDNPTNWGSSSINPSSLISPQAMDRIVDVLKRHPGILDRLPLDSPRSLRLYATNCWPVLVAIIDIVDDPSKANRIIRDTIVQPMTVVQHNSLAQLLFDRMPEIEPDTLFKYLNAVEASCRLLLQGNMQQTHNVRLAVKVIHNALRINDSLADTMFIELCSFCLSYSWVKDALDLYRQLMTAQQQPL